MSFGRTEGERRRMREIKRKKEDREVAIKRIQETGDTYKDSMEDARNC